MKTQSASPWKSVFEAGAPQLRADERTVPIVNAFSVDVEEHFHAQSLAAAYDRSGWDAAGSRVETGAMAVLDACAEAGARGTFFTLGWIAERHKRLIRRIVDEGHELASHGYAHIRVDSQTPEEFRADVRKTRTILEDVGGAPVRGYRAATFSMNPRTPWAWSILKEEGYAYSSSIYPAARYDFDGAQRGPYRPPSLDGFWEFPIASLRLAGRNWPCGGGGYFRLLPYALSRRAIADINRRENRPAIFYIHPWELDPGQPRVRGVGAKNSFRHYVNLSRTAPRLRKLLGDFRWDRIDSVFLNPRAPATGLADA
ncbi:MAG TPA: XrtA system polysaccharide deacetylase [Rhizomicrobium sp.]|jgi:polysaccharide deacetylase family protein (PEP-CTERM system associated)|nr:XrtA system polysaccharide deacetylase [Rhizomicrobium sp.]